MPRWAIPLRQALNRGAATAQALRSWTRVCRCLRRSFAAHWQASRNTVLGTLRAFRNLTGASPFRASCLYAVERGPYTLLFSLLQRWRLKSPLSLLIWGFYLHIQGVNVYLAKIKGNEINGLTIYFVYGC